MPIQTLASLHGLDLPKKLVRLLTLMGLSFALLVAAAPWVLEKLVQARVQAQIQKDLNSHGAAFAQALEIHLDQSELAMRAQAQNLRLQQEREFDKLASQWLQQFPEIVAIRAYAGPEQLMRTRLQDTSAALTEAPAATQALLPLQLLAMQRTEETRKPTRSALYMLSGRPVTDLYVPTKSSAQELIGVTIDTGLWPGLQGAMRLPENIEVEAIPYTLEPGSMSEHLVNDLSWEGLWTLRFRHRDSALSTLQALHPFFIALAVMFCLVVYFALRNLRDRIRAEEALEVKSRLLDQQGRLSTLGEMSASIAHEINQPLAAIANFSVSARLLMRSGKDTSEIEALLTRIEEQSQRAARVMKAVRALIHKEPIQEKTLDLSALLKELKPHLELLTQGHHDPIALSIQTQPQVWIRGDKTLLEQVLLNLVRNSVQALVRAGKPHGRIVIDTEIGNGLAHLRVKDNGPGMAPDVAEHVFESFFSTRTEGLGIGLNFCRSVLERLQGRIELEHNSPQGVCFLVTIPSAAAPNT